MDSIEPVLLSTVMRSLNLLTYFLLRKTFEMRRHPNFILLSDFMASARLSVWVTVEMLSALFVRNLLANGRYGISLRQSLNAHLFDYRGEIRRPKKRFDEYFKGTGVRIPRALIRMTCADKSDFLHRPQSVMQVGPQSTFSQHPSATRRGYRWILRSIVHRRLWSSDRTYAAMIWEAKESGVCPDTSAPPQPRKLR